MSSFEQKATAWLKQAENDLAWAEDSFQSGYFAQVCFICQQVGEKALKAVAYARGANEVRSHSIKQIARDLNLNGEILKAASILDLYYTTGRYPDVLPDHLPPFEFFTQEQAEEALNLAKTILQIAQKEL
ncbi:MAG: HEPN domain-containing protein [Candidatus Hydrogenedentota bacterium]|nr:MAG: HEPN domain-containing protein [Candidatus Hydrogenedentota bacterium]